MVEGGIITKEYKMGVKRDTFDQNGNLIESIDTRTNEDKLKEVIERRNSERGSVQEQLEYLIDNGLQALVQRDNEIKARNPKPQD